MSRKTMLKRKENMPINHRREFEMSTILLYQVEFMIILFNRLSSPLFFPTIGKFFTNKTLMVLSIGSSSNLLSSLDSQLQLKSVNKSMFLSRYSSSLIWI